MTLYSLGLAAYAVLTLATLLALVWIKAPYGRHTRKGWGPSVNARLGWLLMESPALFGVPAIVLAGWPEEPIRWFFLAVWLLHYGQRTLIYPWLIRGRPMPLGIPLLGAAFNTFNALIQGVWLAWMGSYAPSWTMLGMLSLGSALFLTGFLINLQSDHTLRTLRAPGETGYRIPRGHLFEWVSCPNYLGEMLEWLGWAVMTGSPGGLLFALYTVANLGPRALDHHRWYRDTFEDYPEGRRALVPFVL